MNLFIQSLKLACVKFLADSKPETKQGDLETGRCH